jgi:hypothetical protein
MLRFKPGTLEIKVISSTSWTIIINTDIKSNLCFSLVCIFVSMCSCKWKLSIELSCLNVGICWVACLTCMYSAYQKNLVCKRPILPLLQMSYFNFMRKVVLCKTSGFHHVLRPLLFLDVLWHRLVVCYHCFGVACWSYLQGLSKGIKISLFIYLFILL